jgi:hypothetical protein
MPTIFRKKSKLKKYIIKEVIIMYEKLGIDLELENIANKIEKQFKRNIFTN